MVTPYSETTLRPIRVSEDFLAKSDLPQALVLGCPNQRFDRQGCVCAHPVSEDDALWRGPVEGWACSWFYKAQRLRNFSSPCKRACPVGRSEGECVSPPHPSPLPLQGERNNSHPLRVSGIW